MTTATHKHSKKRSREPIDRDALDWTRNASDKSAAANGCRFNLRKAAYAVWWIERHCKLYEGAGFAGEPLILRGCHKCGCYGIPVPDAFDEDGMAACLDRARRFIKCFKAGHLLDWQYECTMRVFGWVAFNEMRQKNVRRFRQASIWVSKKNKKTPTMTAWGLYLLAGDDEPGQKVFLCAKDGMQVRQNAAKHAVEMVRQSPELADPVCTINKVEMRITHEPSRSVMIPLSSSNERTTKSKEGLNGSVLVDETHVVDREFMNRVNRAGKSRPEPLHAEFSTVGDDPDCYGKERFETAQRVIAGTEEIQSMFAAIYAAPQDLKDADLDADPMKFGRMANPAMGHTIDPAEFMDDYRTSRKSPSNFAQFKMYCLNIWQNSASPWLSMDGWNAGKRNIKLEDFEGRACWSALDLASVKDFASLTLAFPEDNDEFALFWWFWLPEDTATALHNLIPIQAWKADTRSNLILTPGARTHYGPIRSHFRELCQRFQIQELAYDDWNAEQTTQEIQEGVQNNAGETIEEATGVQRLNFSQGLKAFNEPTKRFESSVIDGKIIHDGNPIAAWMAGNATIKPDQNGNYKPIKPREGVKKIDGIITAVMAYWRAQAAETYEAGKFYETHELEMA